MNVFLRNIHFIVIISFLFTVISLISTEYSSAYNDSLNLNSPVSPEHGDKFAQIYLVLFFIIVGAAIGRFLSKKFNQPPVLGELIIGVIIGAVLYQFNSPIMTLIRHQDDVNKIIETNQTQNISWNEAVMKSLPSESSTSNGYDKELITIMQSPNFTNYNLTVQIIFFVSNLGVLLLLFLIGVETNMKEMLEVGWTALIVAMIGVIAPSVLGYIVTMFLLPDHSPNLYLFVGATLCATSIGITARVFKDMNRLHLPEAKVVLGAAVIDDILGLIVLAIVAGILSSGSLQAFTIGIILLKTILFLGITLFVGTKLLRQQINFAAMIDNKNTQLLFSFALLLMLAWLSDQIGLAAIVGAFAAGLIIKEEYFKDNVNGKKTVKDVIEPIQSIFAPVFFVMMGMQVDLSSLLNINILGIALILTIVGIIGKLISGIFAKGMDKKIIGIGMIPRGEVGLIFASIGKVMGILDGALFSAIIIVVMLTTFITPPALKWAFEKHDKKLLNY